MSPANTARAERSLLPRIKPEDRLFLLHGTDHAKLSEARRELLKFLLKPEERDANLSEIESTGNRPVPLSKAAGQLIDELSTPPFFPEQRRVIVMQQPQEVFGGSGKSRRKKKPAKPVKKASAKKEGKTSLEERLVQFLDTDFRQNSRNILVVEALEDDDKKRKLSNDSALVQHFRRHGVVIPFHLPQLRFEFEDALIAGNTNRAISIFREWHSTDTRFTILGIIADTTRVLTQAALYHQLERSKGTKKRLGDRKLEDLFPSGWRNLSGKHPRVREKYLGAAHRFSLPKLVEALEQLPNLADSFVPPKDVQFVRPVEEAVENFLLQYFAPAIAPRRR